jgi:hypothetical protein
VAAAENEPACATSRKTRSPLCETSVVVMRPIDQRVAAWRDAGATHLSINTMGAGFSTVEEHIAALASASQAVLG